MDKTQKRAKWVNELLLRMYNLATSRPRVSIALFGIFFILGLPQLNKLKSLYDLNDLIDKDFKTYQSLSLLNEQFADKNQLQIIFSAPSWTEKDLCYLKGLVTDFFFKSRLVLRLNSTLGLKRAKESAEKLLFEDQFNLNCVSAKPIPVLEPFRELEKSPWKGILTSQGSQDIVVNLALKDNDINGRFGSFDPMVTHEIENFFRHRINTEQPDLYRAIEIRSSGLSTFKYYLKMGYQLMQALNGLSLIFCLFIFYFFFRSFKAGFIFSVSLLLTNLSLYMGMGAFGHPVDMLNNALPLMLTMSCLEDFIFLCHFQSLGKSLKQSVQALILPSFLTSLTTAIGFASLMTSELGIIRRFGGWAAVGAMLEWFFVFIVYPTCAEVWPKLTLKVQARKIQLPRFAKKFQYKRGLVKAAGILALAAFPLSIWSVGQLKMKDSPEKIFAEAHPVRQVIDWLRSNKGWAGEVSVLLKSENKDLNARVEAAVRKYPLVVAVESLNEVEKYFIKDVSEDFKQAVIDNFRNSFYSKRLYSEDGYVRLLVYVSSTQVEDINKMRDWFEAEICHGEDARHCQLTGTVVAYAEFGERILRTLFESLALSLFIALSVIYIFRNGTSRKLTLILLLTSAWGPLALIVLFAVLHIPIFYVTSICASLLVGLAGDNAIQFIYFGQDLEQSIQSLQQASLKISLGMMSLCFIFFMAPFVPVKELGIILMMSFVLLYVGDVVLLKWLLRWIKT